MSYVGDFVLPLLRKSISFDGKHTFLAWLPLFLILSLAPRPVNAVEVYQWTDENGVVHFSQWAPTAPEKDVTTLEVDGSPPPGYDPEEDRYNVEANQKYMESLRSDLDARREAEKNQSAAAAQQIIQQPVTPEYGTWPVYPGYGLRPPLRPERPVKPERPVEEPVHTWKPRQRGG